MGPGVFLLGAVLYRNGIFTPQRRRLRIGLIALGFGVALPLDFLLANVFSGALASFSRYGAAVVVSLGILAAVGEFRTMDPVLDGWLAFLVISAILIAFSWAWLRRFSRRPAELLWNWSYRKLARE